MITNTTALVLQAHATDTAFAALRGDGEYHLGQKLAAMAVHRSRWIINRQQITAMTKLSNLLYRLSFRGTICKEGVELGRLPQRWRHGS